VTRVTEIDLRGERCLVIGGASGGIGPEIVEAVAAAYVTGHILGIDGGLCMGYPDGASPFIPASTRAGAGLS
jgi:hypothetical protein